MSINGHVRVLDRGHTNTPVSLMSIWPMYVVVLSWISVCMCLCVYSVYVYLCLCICIHGFIVCVRVCICVDTCAYRDVCVPVCVQVYMYSVYFIPVHVMCACVHVCADVYMCIRGGECRSWPLRLHFEAQSGTVVPTSSHTSSQNHLSRQWG